MKPLLILMLTNSLVFAILMVIALVAYQFYAHLSNKTARRYPYRECLDLAKISAFVSIVTLTIACAS